MTPEDEKDCKAIMDAFGLTESQQAVFQDRFDDHFRDFYSRGIVGVQEAFDAAVVFAMRDAQEVV